jgi:O-acetyl-ADP-ribose deacetylase (regulator of RNase III)
VQRLKQENIYLNKKRKTIMPDIKTKFILFDRNQEMIDSWSEFFKNESDIEIVLGDFDSIKCDAIVSPANSFGFMDGGIDFAIIQKLGWGLQKKLQEQIRNLPEGELLIGNALIIETDNENIPFLISAPTMRIPTNYNIATSINAYLAMKATLIKAINHDKINTVAIPGFCTGTGGMNKRIAAKQMYMAYKEIVKEERLLFSSFKDAQKHHLELNTDAVIWKQ